MHTTDSPFIWQTEQFADIRILRYQVRGFAQLDLSEKLFIWYLYQAAMAGRDIIWDQNYKYNLTIRKTLEAIVRHYSGSRSGADWDNFMIYTKRVWFSNGIHHHYSTDKIQPGFSESYFRSLYDSLHEAQLPLRHQQTADELYQLIVAIIFDPAIAPKRVNQQQGDDLIQTSANNFYDGISQPEAEEFYRSISDSNDSKPVSIGLNSRLVKRNGKIREEVYKADGRYGKAIRKIVIALERAKKYALSELQFKSIETLINFYESGDLRLFDEYSIQWVQDIEPNIDFTNGFIEVYGDPLGYHGSWQSVVSLRDEEASQRFNQLSQLAGYFEQNSPILDEHKRSEAHGISYKVIQAIVQSGDNAPASPIGVNLPNADWIREIYGSKSVSLGNIEDAYYESSLRSGTIEAFYLEEQQERAHRFGHLASKIHTGLHEVIGHGSGKIMPGTGSPKETLRSYASTIEEARADLVALYFIADEKLMETGLIESEEVYKTAYDSYILNGMMRQLVRITPGQQLEESHMRNRQLIAQWVYEKGKPEKVIEKVKADGLTYIRINDYKRLRELFGQLLREIQRIKSEGDGQAAQQLVETYGVQIDTQLHSEMLARWEKLGIAPYAGFIQPQLKAIRQDNRIVDVEISYPQSFTEQMLYYADHYSCLPVWND